ncbi:L domain-like protein [Hesseltinella vesiculosa]|uniref:L domain-like protein n=1 Tax=Hesseltinella vesiculosa TaxID=101127 RepID=A0A1X2GUY2_9FUNG|nr:L domain-like protein [Hesseltinella vesiculosa]
MKLDLDTLSQWHRTEALDSIKEIKARDKGLTHLDDISSCLQLRKLDLAKNQLTNANCNFKGLDQLTMLDLSLNNFESMHGLENMKQLNVLTMGSNKLKSLSMEIANMTQLKALILSKNEIKRIKYLNHLTQLNTLVLSYNNIRTLPSIQAMTQLTKVNLSHNQFSIIPDLTAQAACLKELRLNDNQITTIPATLRQCHALETLDLGNNLIENWSNLAALGSLVQLHNLNLKGNPIANKDSYREKILALVPTLRVFDGQRFDPKFLQRKQKQASNLKLVEKKERLKREKENKLEGKTETKRRHRHVIKEQRLQQQQREERQVAKEEEQAKKRKERAEEVAERKAKKKKQDVFFAEPEPQQEEAMEDVHYEAPVPVKPSKPSKSAKASITKTKPAASMSTKSAKSPKPVQPVPTPSKSTMVRKQKNPKQPMATPEPLSVSSATEPVAATTKQSPAAIPSASIPERSGVLSVIDKSKKSKKAPAEDVVAKLERLKTQEKQQATPSSTGLDADAWD